MKFFTEKEKKLNLALTKLKNLNLQNPNTEIIVENLNNQKNNKDLISSFIKNGFRRSYDSLYIPICENCNACISTRINIDKFTFSKRNKRVLKFNKDLFFIKNTKKKLDQRFYLFNEYCSIRHGSSQMAKMSKKEFESFFYKSKNKIEICDLSDSKEKIFGSIIGDSGV